MTKKPKGVPADATFHEEWGEWILGEKKNGKCVGEWRQWHPTKGHLTCIDVFDSRGQLTYVTRYHADGTFSMKQPHRNGKPHGIATYQGSKKPSTERMLENVPSKHVFRFELTFEDGSQTVPARWFDAKGREIDLQGRPKPKNVPDQARAQELGIWGLGKEELQKKFKGFSKTWRADGSVEGEEERDSRGKIKWRKLYHPDGSIARELDYLKNTGSEHRPKTKAKSEIGFDPPMPIVRCTFGMKSTSRDSGIYFSENPRFFDAKGTELTEAAKPLAPAPKDAVAVTDGCWSEPQRYWKTTTKNIDRYARMDGTTFLEIAPSLVRRFDSKGILSVEERLHPKRRDKNKRRIATGLTVRVGSERLEIACDDAGHVTTITSKKVVFDASKLPKKLDTAAFGKILKQSFAKLLKHDDLIVSFGSFELSTIEMSSEKKYFRATALVGDGGGNSAIVVEEGKHAGAVFFLDHEQGLFALDCVDDVLEEEGIDPKKMSRDKLIERMPFFENPIASSLHELLRGISIRSRTTYYDELAAFAPLKR